MDDRKEFARKVTTEIENMHHNKAFQEVSSAWMRASLPDNYCYHFRWMGLPIIQYPQDIMAMQEIIWDIKPDCIIETGVARGGSVIFYASMLKMMGINGRVIGVDVDIRPHNREAIEHHPLSPMITLIQGSSIDPVTAGKVRELSGGAQRILVVLDSMHTHAHVLEELRLYSPLVHKGGYCVVFDTVIENMPPRTYDRPWDVGNNPKTAVREFLKTCDRFEIDTAIPDKLQISVAPDGYLKCTRG